MHLILGIGISLGSEPARRRPSNESRGYLDRNFARAASNQSGFISASSVARAIPLEVPYVEEGQYSQYLTVELEEERREEHIGAGVRYPISS